MTTEHEQLILVDAGEYRQMQADLQQVLEVASFMAKWCGDRHTDEQEAVYYHLLAHLEARIGKGRKDPYSQRQWNGPEWASFTIPWQLRHDGPVCDGCCEPVEHEWTIWCGRCMDDATPEERASVLAHRARLMPA